MKPTAAATNSPTDDQIDRFITAVEEIAVALYRIGSEMERPHLEAEARRKEDEATRRARGYY